MGCGAPVKESREWNYSNSFVNLPIPGQLFSNTTPLTKFIRKFYSTDSKSQSQLKANSKLNSKGSSQEITKSKEISMSYLSDVKKSNELCLEKGIEKGKNKISEDEVIVHQGEQEIQSKQIVEEIDQQQNRQVEIGQIVIRIEDKEGEIVKNPQENTEMVEDKVEANSELRKKEIKLNEKKQITKVENQDKV